MTRPTTVPPQSVTSLVPTSAPTRRAGTASGLVVDGAPERSAEMYDAWQMLGAWLRQGRIDRGFTVAEVARTTKIQARILEDLEAGNAEDLPADVFVRGFVRNYARCVGLSEAEALARYAACGRDFGPVASPAASAVAELYAPTVRKSRMATVVPVAPGSSAAEVHALGPQAPRRAATSPGIAVTEPRYARAATVPPEPAPSARSASARMPAVGWPVSPSPTVVEDESSSPAIVVDDHGSHKRRRSRLPSSRREQRAHSRRAPTVRPELDIYEDLAAAVAPNVAAGEVEVAAVAAEPAPVLEAAPPSPEPVAPAAVAVAVEPVVHTEAPELWVPKMPAAAPPRQVTAAGLSPSLIIDDADPESASRLQETRANDRSREGRDPTRRTFLPPILLESQERASRQGGLTLAVIILLIAATLTLSYLMRRPTSGGGGMTQLGELPSSLG